MGGNDLLDCGVLLGAVCLGVIEEGVHGRKRCRLVDCLCSFIDARMFLYFKFLFLAPLSDSSVLPGKNFNRAWLTNRVCSGKFTSCMARVCSSYCDQAECFLVVSLAASNSFGCLDL